MQWFVMNKRDGYLSAMVCETGLGLGRSKEI